MNSEAKGQWFEPIVPNGRTFDVGLWASVVQNELPENLGQIRGSTGNAGPMVIQCFLNVTSA